MLDKLPVVICSSVIRSANVGQSHGGIYLVDLDKEKAAQVVNWDNPNISWAGRGAERGLRGIAFYDGMTITASSDEIFFYDQEFNIVKSYKNKYLKHCHEISVGGDVLLLSSTGFDSILLFDLKKEKFTKGYCVRVRNKVLRKLDKIPNKLNLPFGVKYGIDFFEFDPNSDGGPSEIDTHHINDVFERDGDIYFCGTGMTRLMKITKDGKLEKTTRLPGGTHNVQFYNNYLLFNRTASDSISLRDKKGKKIQDFEIAKYEKSETINVDIPKDHARQGFGRGLCSYKGYIIGGSSPATVSVYRMDERKPIKRVNISKDVRNAVHGLEVYPYEVDGSIFG